MTNHIRLIGKKYGIANFIAHVDKK